MVLVAVARVAAQPGDDARVLDRVVRVVEHRAADADTGLAALAHHLGEPVAVDDLDVVVQQQQILARSVLAAKIVDAAEIEPALVGHDPGAVVAVGQLFVVGRRGGVGGVVLNDDDLKILIGRLGVDAVQAFFQIVGVIFVGDQNRHEGLRLRDVPDDVAGAGKAPGLHPALPPGGGQVVRHSALGGLLDIRLGRCAAAGGCRVYTPVVEHLRDVQRLGCGVSTLHFIDEAQE